MKIDKPYWLDNESGVNVAVIGDLMLDQYVDADVKRISPEAPVPVCNVSSIFYRAGGASNSSLNIQLAGGKAHLFGFTGNDNDSSILLDLLSKEGVDVSGVIKIDQVETIKKIRLTSERQQIVRIDVEKNIDYTSKYKSMLLKKVSELEKLDAILLSDYGKGTLDHELTQGLIKLANSRSIPIVIDPKGNDYTKYSGATMITPNRSEACIALNIKPDSSTTREFLASSLKSRFNIDCILLTLGSDGIFLYSGDEPQSVYLKAQAREVYDVSGAGDTVASIVCLALASGMNLVDAVTIANIAAGVVVEKWGTSPVSKEELLGAIREYEGVVPSRFSVSSKIKDLAFLKAYLEDKSTRKKKVVFTNGCFDILHVGHVSYLQKASYLGDELVVAINSDSSVRRLKGKTRPINCQDHRALLIAALGFVDWVILFDEDTPKNLIEALVPDVLVKGADWKVSDIVGSDFVIKNGGKVETIELEQGLSTTNLIGKIKNLD